MQNHFSCALKAEIGNLPAVLDALSDFMASNGWTPEAISDSALATDEAITNIILHGYKEPEGEIRLLFEASGNEVAITIEDDAPPFNPIQFVPAEIHGDIPDRPVGGLGILLIRNVMDAVSYEFRDGRNIFTMKKRKT